MQQMQWLVTIVVLFATRSAFAGDCASNINVETVTIPEIVSCLLEKEAELNSRTLPTEVVVISPIRCSALPGRWDIFADAAGRFIVGVGAGTDENGEVRNFDLNDTGGEFRHKLVPGELPRHSHTFNSMGDDDNTGGDRVQVGNSNPGRFGTMETRAAGGDDPHNNIPPFLAMHFCQQVPAG